MTVMKSDGVPLPRRAAEAFIISHTSRDLAAFMAHSVCFTLMLDDSFCIKQSDDYLYAVIIFGLKVDRL